MKKKENGFLEVRGLIDIEAIAASLAAASEEEQAPFFNVFFKALRADCGNQYTYEKQLSFIFDKLEAETINGCNFLGSREL